MNAFDFDPRTRIVYGPGKIDTLGELGSELGCGRALVVSDPGVCAAGHAEHAITALHDAGFVADVFDHLGENPTTRDVEDGVAVARQFKPDLLVGLGGGSSMDCAKGINFVYTNGGKMQDYWGRGKATKPMLPMIAVPTTAGTGSDAQSFAIISDAETHVKMACGDKKAACRIALLDPVLTLTQPREVAAATGIDAIAHALESYVTTARNPLSQLFARRAWTLLAENYQKIFEDPQDLEARGAMLVGANFAGMAIECSMLGATHSCANPITARFGTTHGRAIAVMLPHVLRMNAQAVGSLYLDLVHDTSKNSNNLSPASAGNELANSIEEYVKLGGLPRTLRDCGVERDSLALMAHEATGQWTANFNPKPLSETQFLELFECAY